MIDTVQYPEILQRKTPNILHVYTPTWTGCVDNTKSGFSLPVQRLYAEKFITEAITKKVSHLMGVKFI